MDGYLIALLLFPIIWPWIAKAIWHTHINFQEVGLAVVASCILTTCVWYAGVYTSSRDTEILNGEVISKTSDRVHCRHSYSCNCRTSCSGSGSSRSCSTVCDTCYEHSFDMDWNVRSNIGVFSINTIDRQGLREPPRWTEVKKGDSVSKTNSYVNWVKAAKSTLFKADESIINKYASSVPPYPDKIYDYYKINRVLSVGVPVKDLTNWNNDLSEILKKLGPQKQANAVILFTKIEDSAYHHAVENSWIGGKKNDIIVIIGVKEYPKISWVSVLSWSKNKLIHVQLRDDIKDVGIVDREKITPIVEAHIRKSFVKMEMKDYEYLKYQIDPPLWLIIFATIVSFGSSLGLTYFFHREDVRFF